MIFYRKCLHINSYFLTYGKVVTIKFISPSEKEKKMSKTVQLRNLKVESVNRKVKCITTNVSFFCDELLWIWHANFVAFKCGICFFVEIILYFSWNPSFFLFFLSSLFELNIFVFPVISLIFYPLFFIAWFFNYFTMILFL